MPVRKASIWIVTNMNISDINAKWMSLHSGKDGKVGA